MNNRKADLEELYRTYNDESLPTEVRRKAYHTYQEIQRQLSNKPLMEARERLVKAQQAGDYRAVEKITNEIHARFGH